MPRKSAPAFTLTELLIVIGIIAVLAALLMPALGRAQREARMVSCLGNLKQISHEIESYQANYHTQYPPWLSTTDLYETPEVLVCPEDESGGDEGSRPDWISDPSTSQFAETNDMDPKDFSRYDDAIPPNGSRYGDLRWYFDNFNKYLTPHNKRRTEDYRRDLKKNSGAKVRGSSYLYELNGECVSWNVGGGYKDLAPDASWYDAKMYEKDYCTATLKKPAMAARIPIVRCFFHIVPRGDGTIEDRNQPAPNVPALRITGTVDKSWPKAWEND